MKTELTNNVHRFIFYIFNSLNNNKFKMHDSFHHNARNTYTPF